MTPQYRGRTVKSAGLLYCTLKHCKIGVSEMHHVIRALLILSTIYATPLVAADICVSDPANATIVRRAANATAFQRTQLDQVVPFLGLNEHLRRFIPQLGTTPPSSLQPVGSGEETRFSWWAYGHTQLHESGVIKEIEQAFGKDACCGGVHAGECRITKFVPEDEVFSVGKPKRVYIDDLECPISQNTHTTQLIKFRMVGHVVVCAGRTTGDWRGTVTKRVCPSTYCLGTTVEEL